MRVDLSYDVQYTMASHDTIARRDRDVMTLLDRQAAVDLDVRVETLHQARFSTFELST